jgi:hypothetical protein
MDKRRKELVFIAVGALVVLVALYLTFRPRAKPAVATTPPAAAPAQAQPRPVGTEPEAQEPALVESGAATTPGRNPFRPVLVAQAPRPGGAPGGSTPGGLAPLPFGPWLEPLPGAGTTPAPAPADDRLRLTGIVDGERPVAVLRQGPKRYFVTIGDPVDSQYTVKSISDGRVVLASGKGTLSLTLGGRI